MKTIVEMKFGSHLYGLATPQSDTDYKGIYMPSFESLLLQNFPKTISSSTGDPNAKNQATDIDREAFSLPYFLQLAIKGETVAIDMLHCEEPIDTSAVWEELVTNRTRFYSKNLKAFMGYVKRQAAKYGVKGSRLAAIKEVMDVLTMLDDPGTARLSHVWDRLPENEFAKKVIRVDSDVTRDFYEVNGKLYQTTMSVLSAYNSLHNMYNGYGERAKLAEKNQGVDWKAVSHALRAGYQARDIFKNGDFKYPLDETDFILAVKQGRLDFATEVAPVLEDLVVEVEALSARSSLPETVDADYWSDWLLKVYKDEYNLRV